MKMLRRAGSAKSGKAAANRRTPNWLGWCTLALGGIAVAGDCRGASPDASVIERVVQAGKRLPHDLRHGYLPAMLGELNISEKSQVLVFSKTSFQRSRIGPRRPRAIYFNDDAYVGWVQDGEVLEIVATRPGDGPVFYTLEQSQADRPKLVRQTHECLSCHSSPAMMDTPELLVRSVFPGPSGAPVLRAGSFRTNPESPLAERWGGWYVTGTHGRQRHMGNAILRGTDDPEKLDRQPGANLADLGKRLDVRPYLTPHSDIVALMVLEHQVAVHNQIALAGHQARLAQRDQEVLNRMSGKPPSEPIDSIDRRYQAAADDVLKCLLFKGEIELTDPIRGTSGFAEYSAGLGPRDKQGRSLREFDLNRKLFKYPCSYLIYSPAFDGLPETVKSRVLRGLWIILTGQAGLPEGVHLDRDQRQAIYEILANTKPGLPACWKSVAKPGT